MKHEELVSRRAALCCILLLFIAVDRTLSWKKKKKITWTCRGVAGPCKTFGSEPHIWGDDKLQGCQRWHFSNNMFERYPAGNKAINGARIKIRKCFKKFKLFGHTLRLNNQTAVHRCFRTETINISFSEGCYGVKPDSVGDSWTCSRCAKGAWVVVSNSQVTYIFFFRNNNLALR